MKRRTTLILTGMALLGLAAIGKSALAQQSPRVIVQTNYWALPGKADEVCQWRMHASDVREKLGLPRGRVLCRQGNSEVLPDVMWQIELPNDPGPLSTVAERNRDIITSPAPEFREVIRHMATLTRRFELSTWLPE